MSSNLSAYEARLREHFSSLAASKKDLGLSHPVFCLEHCLSASEVNDLGAELSTSLRSVNGMSESFWLSWLVHAVEQGYDFDGLEYWRSFAERTQNWDAYGNRNQLRSWFKKFSKTYSGATPSGSWASHYAYISWPITNALLPRDLQVQLAHSLFNARHHIRRISGMAPSEMGRMVADRTQASTSRYRFFLQQEDLVGHIVHALLQEDASNQSAIYAPTLSRITTDLNTKGNAREWLNDARRYYARISFDLPSPKQTFSSSFDPAPMAALATTYGLDRPLLIPSLSLHHVPNGSWSVVALIPSFQTLLNLHPEFRRHLDRVRVIMPAYGPQPSPGISLLSGISPRQRTLKAWPPTRECLLQFDLPLPDFDQLVQNECRLEAAVFWLFKQREDGTASHISSLLIRPSAKYILISRDIRRIAALGPQVVVNCEGVSGVSLEIPSVVDRVLEAKLKGAGLQVQRSAKIEPIGLVPRHWDGELGGEWLTTETPCFSITRDHEFDSYQLVVNGGPAHTVACGTSQSSIFLIENLGVGQHELTISTWRTEASPMGSYPKQCGSHILRLHVREPTAWVRGSLCHAAIVVDVNPPSPSMDDFLAERVELSVEGDRARTATCTLVLTDASGTTVAEHPVLSHPLPVKQDVWAEAQHKFLTNGADGQDFLSAAGGYILIETADLGEYRIHLHRDPHPLRWAYRASKNVAKLRLIDEGIESETTVTRYDFTRPFVPITVDKDAAFKGIDVAVVNSLFVAEADGELHAAVVSASTIGKSFDWFDVKFDVSEIRKVRDPSALLEWRELWTNAWPCSAISRHKQRRVVKEIHTQLIACVCGIPWSNQERSLHGRRTEQEWEALERCVDGSPPSYAISLSRGWIFGGCTTTEQLRLHHLKVSKSFKVSGVESVIDLAWLVAADVLGQESSPLKAGLPKFSDFAKLVRGARLLVLSRDLNRKVEQ